MTHIKVNKRWYHLESLTDLDKMRLGIWPEDSKEEIIEDLEQLKEDLKKVPESVKKNPVVSKKENVKTGKVIIGSPSLKENKKKKK